MQIGLFVDFKSVVQVSICSFEKNVVPWENLNDRAQKGLNMIPSGRKNAARIVSDGFYLFAHKPTSLVTLVLARLTILKEPLNSEGLEIFRAVRISGGQVRHDPSNISFELSSAHEQQAIVLSDIYLTPDFGIAIALDPDIAQFEFSPSLTITQFTKLFQFKTLDGHTFEPECYFKIL